MRSSPLTPPAYRQTPDGERDLILVGHGSRDPAAGAVLRSLRDAVALALPSITVTLAWIELDVPLLADVLSGAQHPDPDRAPVVVPLLLSRGMHVARDLPGRARGPLGPDPVLTTMLMDHILQANIAPGRPLVLAATGSTDPEGVNDVRAQADLLEKAWGAPVRAGFVTTDPTISDAAAQAAAAGGAPPAIVSYFLAAGRIPDTARVDTAHLGDHPALVSLVLMRYRGAAPGGVPGWACRRTPRLPKTSLWQACRQSSGRQQS